MSSVYTHALRVPSTARAQQVYSTQTNPTKPPNMHNTLRLMQVYAYVPAWRTDINTSIRGMQSAWCIIQWPQVGGFSQCCYHNVCAQTPLRLFIWIHNEKKRCRAQGHKVCAQCPFLWAEEVQEKYQSVAIEMTSLVSPEKQQRMPVNTFVSGLFPHKHCQVEKPLTSRTSNTGFYLHICGPN